MPATSLETQLTSKGMTCSLPGDKLVATLRYNGMGGWSVEFAEGEAQRIAQKLLGDTTDVGQDTAEYMALVVACEMVRTDRYAGVAA